MLYGCLAVHIAPAAHLNNTPVLSGCVCTEELSEEWWWWHWESEDQPVTLDSYNIAGIAARLVTEGRYCHLTDISGSNTDVPFRHNPLCSKSKARKVENNYGASIYSDCHSES